MTRRGILPKPSAETVPQKAPRRVGWTPPRCAVRSFAPPAGSRGGVGGPRRDSAGRPDVARLPGGRHLAGTGRRALEETAQFRVRTGPGSSFVGTAPNPRDAGPIAGRQNILCEVAQQYLTHRPGAGVEPHRGSRLRASPHRGSRPLLKCSWKRDAPLRRPDACAAGAMKKSKGVDNPSRLESASKQNFPQWKWRGLCEDELILNF